MDCLLISLFSLLFFCVSRQKSISIFGGLHRNAWKLSEKEWSLSSSTIPMLPIQRPHLTQFKAKTLRIQTAMKTMNQCKTSMESRVCGLPRLHSQWENAYRYGWLQSICVHRIPHFITWCDPSTLSCLAMCDVGQRCILVSSTVHWSQRFVSHVFISRNSTSF